MVIDYITAPNLGTINSFRAQAEPLPAKQGTDIPFGSRALRFPREVVLSAFQQSEAVDSGFVKNMVPFHGLPTDLGTCNTGGPNENDPLASSPYGVQSFESTTCAALRRIAIMGARTNNKSADNNNSKKRIQIKLICSAKTRSGS